MIYERPLFSFRWTTTAESPCCRQLRRDQVYPFLGNRRSSCLMDGYSSGTYGVSLLEIADAPIEGGAH